MANLSLIVLIGKARSLAIAEAVLFVVVVVKQILSGNSVAVRLAMSMLKESRSRHYDLSVHSDETALLETLT